MIVEFSKHHLQFQQRDEAEYDANNMGGGAFNMNSKRRLIIIVGLTMVLVVSIGIVIVTQGGEMRTRNAIDRFARRVEQGNLDDVRLVIYFMSPFIVTNPPVGVEVLVDRRHELRIVIEGDTLKEHSDRLGQMNGDLLISDNSQSVVDTRIYFFFETTRGQKIFDVAMWMDGNSNVLINGHEFKWNYVFVDIIIPFLPNAEAEMLQDYLNFEWSRVTRGRPSE